MANLQKVNLGAIPDGAGGDDERTAFNRGNTNVDVFNTQAVLTSAQPITAPQALTDAHVGKRVNISLAAAGVVNMPTASTCAADNVILLRNIGATVVTLAITAGSGDSVALSRLNPGETALMDTDGVHAWTVLMRGRTNSDNEAVNGNYTVGGDLGVTGTVTVNKDANLKYAAGNQRGINWLVGASIRWRVYTDGTAEAGSNAGSNLALARYTDAGAYVDSALVINRASGVFAFTARPTFASKVPWDSGNLPAPVASTNNAISLTWTGGTAGITCKIDATNIGSLIDSSSAQTITGVKTFTGVGTTGSYVSSPIVINAGAGGAATMGFVSNNVNSGGVFRLNSTSVFEFVNFNASGYAPITCSAVTQTSDQALKTGISPLSDVLSKLRGKRAVLYSLKSDATNARNVGVLAQEWQQDFPELVVETGIDIDEDGDAIAHQYDDEGNEIFGPNGKPKSRKALGFNYSNASAVALQGVIDLQAALDAALLRIAALEVR